VSHDISARLLDIGGWHSSVCQAPNCCPRWTLALAPSHRLRNRITASAHARAKYHGIILYTHTLHCTCTRQCKLQPPTATLASLHTHDTCISNANFSPPQLTRVQVLLFVAEGCIADACVVNVQHEIALTWFGDSGSKLQVTLLTGPCVVLEWCAVVVWPI